MARFALKDVHWLRVIAASAALLLVSRDLDIGVDVRALLRSRYVKGLVIVGIALSGTRTHLPSAIVTLIFAAVLFPALPKVAKELSDIPPGESSLPYLPSLPPVPSAASQLPAMPPTPFF